VPTPKVLDEAIAEGSNVQNVGPFDDNDAGTDVLRTRYFIYVPVKYARIILEQSLTPRQDWERLGGAIFADNAADACAAFIDWMRATCTVRADNQASTVQRAALTVPLGDSVLQADRLELMRRDLSGRFLTPAVAASNDSVAAALGDLTHEYRKNRAEALARNTAEPWNSYA
jgi:hypothetical protein